MLIVFSKDRQLIPESVNGWLECLSITGKRISQTSQYPTFKKPVVNDYGTSIRNVREQGFQKRWTWVGYIGMQVFVICDSTVGSKNVTTILKRKFFVDLKTVEPWNRRSIGFKIEEVDRISQLCYFLSDCSSIDCWFTFEDTIDINWHKCFARVSVGNRLGDRRDERCYSLPTKSLPGLWFSE